MKNNNIKFTGFLENYDDVISLPEIVSGGYVLVEPIKSEAVAEGVEKVYKGEVEKGEKKAFSWDKCVEKYLEVYKKEVRLK